MNRVALDLGFVQIYWYSICILVGMMVGMFVVYRETIRKKISDNLITNLIFYTIIIAIIGARLYYVIFDWGYYSKNMLEIFEIWNGGLAIHGAIILGGLFLIYFTRIHKLDTLKVLDICSVGLIIGQAIGRWGNFFNQEVYGGVVSREFLKGLFLPDFIVDGMKVLGEYHQPLFLYESMLNFLGLVLIYVAMEFVPKVKAGTIGLTYVTWYSIIRLSLEGLRVEKFSFHSTYVMSGIWLALSVILIILNQCNIIAKTRKYRCKFFLWQNFIHFWGSLFNKITISVNERKQKNLREKIQQSKAKNLDWQELHYRLNKTKGQLNYAYQKRSDIETQYEKAKNSYVRTNSNYLYYLGR